VHIVTVSPGNDRAGGHFGYFQVSQAARIIAAVDGTPSDSHGRLSPEPLSLPTQPPNTRGAPAMLVFLIADIRGYTRYTAENGNQAAGDFVARFAEIVQAAVKTHRGELVELRGDEALIVFGSARSAAVCALALREAFVDETLEHPERPMPVGIGLDAGEAVQVEGGYRGAALNVAARLCSVARAGEILVTAEFAHLVGKLDSAVFRPGGQAELKGLPEPVRQLRLAPAQPDPARQAAFSKLTRPPPSRWRRRRLVIAATVVALAAAGVGMVVTQQGSAHAMALPGESVAVLDRHGRVRGDVPVTGTPTAVTAAGGAMWVATDGAVVRIDPKHLAVVDVVRDVGPSPTALCAFDGSVWVAVSGTGQVAQINTATDTVVAHIPVGNQPAAIVAAYGRLWVANLTDATITVIDPATQAARTIPVGDAPDAIVAAGGSIWVANRDDNTVSAVDPHTLAVGNPVSVGAGPVALAAGAGGLWVADSLDRTVTRIDPVTSQQIRIVVGNDPSALTAAGNTLWVSTAGDGRLMQIDLRTNQLRAIATGSSPVAAVAVGDRLWSVQQSFASTAHFGGTLVVSDDQMFGGEPGRPDFDPQENYGDALYFPMVYDGLVRLAPVPGPAGYEVVPDLAVALPRPSPDGLTYVFTVRTGVRYSDGRLVHASDFVRGLQRVFTSGGSQNYATADLIPAVRGVAGCMVSTSRCTLGITADDRTGTVTFQLTHPDPDFLAELTLPYDSPAPPGTPSRHVLADHAYLGTGPYMFASVSRDESDKLPTVTAITLSRNPYFHVWSTAAQPRGYPDTIRFVSATKPQIGVAQVLGGHSDLARLRQDLGATIGTLQRTHPAQVRTSEWPAVQYAAINLNLPPFNNPTARRALSLAMNRAAAYGSGPWRPACRIVPPDFPGSPRGCPANYTPTGDIAQARALLSTTPKYNGLVTVIVYNDPQYLQFGQAYAAAARALGYRTRLLPLTDGYSQDLNNPNAGWNIAANAWAPDYPAPSTYYLPLFACPSSERPSSRVHKAATIDLQCDPRRDAQAAAVQSEQLRDPGRAIAAWTRLYAQLDEQLPIIPTNKASNMYLVSGRLRNFRTHLIYGPLYDQMWVR
jgi:YVTN family beta-propeller protein